MNMSRHPPKYPEAVNALLGALAFEHDPDEVKAVQYALERPRERRTPYVLTSFGRGFTRRFLKKPVAIRYDPCTPDRFNHASRELSLSKPELVRLLHEIGHAKYGASEDAAVFYSLGLILKAEPKFTPILKGHVLMNDPYL